MKQILQSIKTGVTEMAKNQHLEAMNISKTRVRRVLILSGLLMLMPIFATIGANGVVFDRFGGAIEREVLTFSGFVISLPFSLFFLAYMSFKMKFFPVRSKFFMSTFFIYVSLMMVSYIIHEEIDKNLIKNLSYLILFLYTITLMTEYFRRTLTNQSLVMAYQANFVLIPGVIILMITMLNFFRVWLQCGGYFTYCDGYGYFISEWFMIYNFDQYFVLAMLPLLAVAFVYSKVIWFFTAAAYFTLALVADNDTAMIIGACLIFFQCFVRPTLNLISVSSYKILFLLMFIVLIISPMLVNWLYFNADIIWFLYNKNNYENPNNLWVRIQLINAFFDELSSSSVSVFFPFMSGTRLVHGDYHNEFLVIYRSIGLFALIYYLWIYKKIQSISNSFLDVKFVIALLVFIAAAVITPTLHPYTGIYLGALFAFYSRLTDLLNEP